MFKLISDLFGYLFLLFMVLSPLLLILAVFLVWKGFGIVRVLGCLLLLLVAYYRIGWISPWFITRGSDQVQVFSLHDPPFGTSPSVRWMEASNKLILVPDERVIFVPQPPEYNHVLVVDLEARQSYWQPKDEVSLDETRLVMNLPTGLSKLGTHSEFTYIGFGLPILFYKIPWVFSEISGWQWEETYFGWARDVVRESESGPVVVELNQIVFNTPRQLAGASSRWVMKGKFVIVEPDLFVDRRVLVLGPFNTSKHTQSKDTNSKE